VYVKKNYPQWNRRRRKEKEIERLSKTSADAQTIKYADIIDNATEIANHDTGFAGKFLQECKALLEKMDKGDTELYKKAIEVVEKGLEILKERN